MYIQKVKINNIRGIAEFEMTFPPGQEAGWHVIIGDNGAGKSTIIRAISIGLIGENEAKSLNAFQDWKTWLNPSKPKGEIELTISRDNDFDKPIAQAGSKLTVLSKMTIQRKNGPNSIVDVTGELSQNNALFGSTALSGWFSISYGPFRRLKGGDGRFKDLFVRRPRLAAHLSAFLEEVDLHHVIDWVKDCALDAPKSKKDKAIVEGFIKFINESDLLPHNARIQEINSEGVLIKDANEVIISIYEMSDGYRSVLGMIMDLIRYLVSIYGEQKVFTETGVINLPGVVLIDEIDAHLHPTWQARIGEWLLKYFPRIQFIVTTHTPIICRAAEKGSVWYLFPPGKQEIQYKQLTGTDFDKLIYGNLMDAFSTHKFGDGVERLDKAYKMLEKLAFLTQKKMYAVNMSDEELAEYERLTKTFQSDVIPGI